MQNNADPCVYVKAENKDGREERLVIIALYFDDMVLATNDKTVLEKVKGLLTEKFEIEDIVFVCQSQEIELQRF